jgi:hypothetical protein
MRSAERGDLRHLNIGDQVTYNGRRYAVAGFTPVSVTPFRVGLHDPESGDSFWVDWPPQEPVERVALRLAPEPNERPPDAA